MKTTIKDFLVGGTMTIVVFSFVILLLWPALIMTGNEFRPISGREVAAYVYLFFVFGGLFFASVFGFARMYHESLHSD